MFTNKFSACSSIFTYEVNGIKKTLINLVVVLIYIFQKQHTSMNLRG